MKRAVIIVLDGVGIGEMPDAANYGDEGSNTLVNIKKQYMNMNIPNLINLGIGNIDGASLLGTCDNPKAAYGKIAEASKGKDTTTGHWEIAGLITNKPFPTYINGFSNEIIAEFENKIGRKTLANYASSGTEIINKLGDEHVKTGYPIVYTSADSVFQLAAHEDVIPVDKLYEMCQVARDMLPVARVIARPFIGSGGKYTRTKNRKDFSLKPYAKTMLDYIKESGKETACVGKIEDIFSGVGVTSSVHTTSNTDGVDKTIEVINNVSNGLIFTNLVDFDMEYGHRNDVQGFKNALEQFDIRLPKIMESLKDNDILFITADHGCDPTTPSTDHSREYVPLLVYGKNIKPVNLNIKNTFADIGATILHYLDVSGDINGNSFLDTILL